MFPRPNIQQQKNIYIYIALGNIANLTHGWPMSVQTSELRGTFGIVRCLYIFQLSTGIWGYDLCGRSFPWISQGALRRRISMNFMRYDAHVRYFEQRSRIQNATRSASSGTCYLYRWQIECGPCGFRIVLTHWWGHCQKYAKHCCWKVPCQTFCRCFLRAAAWVPDGRTSSKVVSTPNHLLAKHTSAVLVDRWGGARQNIFDVPWMKIEMRWGREVSLGMKYATRSSIGETPPDADIAWFGCFFPSVAFARVRVVIICFQRGILIMLYGCPSHPYKMI